uniref:Uncharacterized protein n=1 Tax=Hemiselmis tepida TaxID=464990 RepID=A0A7S0W4M5_9CRYP|mmetsp:Transcript_28060/g.71018  ORF Transcript_28060/g.71018 Transcript_28060/m.71018 type:complete len:104 (+) Transcript_28060:191-502(+)
MVFAILVYHCPLCTSGPVPAPAPAAPKPAPAAAAKYVPHMGGAWDKHGSDHGVAFRANASFYLRSSSSTALKGGAAHGQVVDARHSSGCQDNWKGFGCHQKIF